MNRGDFSRDMRLPLLAELSMVIGAIACLTGWLLLKLIKQGKS